MEPIDVFFAGIESLQEYLSAHVLTCLIPAFFIAGAIAVFISKQSILKYFGSDTKKHISYSVAAVSGAILAVCSCTVLPLFTGIYKRGAGIGPATAFLFSGPAINILAIVLTAQVLGYDIGLARAIAAVVMAVVVGMIMAFLFRHEEKKKNTDAFSGLSEPEQKRPLWVSLLFFVLLISILVVGAASTAYIPLIPKIAAVITFLIVLGIVLIKYYDKEEIKRWGQATWNLTKKILPILLLGVFVVGIISGVASFFTESGNPSTSVGELVAPYIGGNSLVSCFVASVIGAILYMPTLLEVAIVGDLFGYTAGIMGGGPALALLLAGPSLSLPNMIVITKVLGVKKALVYFGLVIIIAAVVGFSYGVIRG